METGWIVLLGVVYLLGLGPSAVWTLAGHREEKHPPVPWKWWQVLEVAVLYFLCVQLTLLAATALRGELDVAGKLTVLAGASLLFLGLAVWWLRTVKQATAADLGWQREKLWRDVALGVAAFILIAPAVYFIQYVVQMQLGQAQEHQLVRFLRADPSWSNIGLTAAQAIVVAPLVEEFLFRVVLQGWLEGFAGRLREQGITLLGASLWLPAVLFAAMHYTAWPDPIPLLFFALGLGLLYRWTHRLAPIVTLHMCLNATSLVALVAEISRAPG